MSNFTQKLLFLKANNHNQQENFGYITWLDLIELITKPLIMAGTREEAKAKSPVIAAHSAPQKTKDSALKHNQFTLLRLDLDDTVLLSDAIADKLEKEGLQSYLIHTTASHQYNDKGNRYRVYIELGEPLTYQEWAMLETYLSSLFYEVDDCASRPSQIMYLPFSFDGYEFIHNEGEAVTKAHSIFAKALAYTRELSHHQAEKQQQAVKQGFKKSFKEKLVGTQISIIDLIEQSYDWESLLASHGYKRKGKAYLAPESTSGIAGAYLLHSSDGKTRLYSHHSNDPCHTGKAIDKADFIAIREFNGDTGKAIATIAKTYFPEAHKHNLSEWKTNKHNEAVLAVSEHALAEES